MKIVSLIIINLGRCRIGYFVLFPFCLSFLITCFIMVTPAYSVTLTNIKHLFDITYEFSAPSDVSVSTNGRVYVVDGVNSRIKIFNSEGKFISSFGEKGSEKGRFMYPLGIDTDNSGKVYVADSGNHRVQIFDPNGTFIAEIKMPPKSKPADPTDVSVDNSQSRCYIVDNDNHSILVYDLNTLKLIDTYGGEGSGKGKFRYPFLLTLDKKGYLYIVDVINTRVQVLNPQGFFVAAIGGWGVEKGEFFRPKGVAIDKNDRVYVSDSYLGVIQVFDNVGGFRSVLSETGTGKVKKFETPVGISIDDNNILYVVEMFANRVGVYRIEENSNR
jgi:DNA-binding beta-propeller fold protein YncE